ncbi:MAG TPA: hypothetical protein VKK06_07995 [Terriglobia bacterium]|nr:hypothetical protein [Terriglobia bacterium]
MKLSEVRLETSNNGVRLSGRVEGLGAEPYFEFPLEFQNLVTDTADPFVPALVVPALERGEPLEIVPPVSPQLAARIPRIVDTLTSLFPKFRRAPVVVHERQGTPSQTGTMVATLFSSGVDSFYTLLKGLKPDADPGLRPTHLLFIQGHEQRLGETSGADGTVSAIREVARETGTGVISGFTNLRALFGLNYEVYYQGALLAASALALSRGVKRLIVSSTFTYSQLRPWGSHPLLDELWSTETMEIVHDGAEARRVDKIARIVSRHPLALKHLRVCLYNQESPRNCGHCKKCARTMMALELIGKLRDTNMFPLVSRQELARGLRKDDPHFLDELYDFARELGNTEGVAFLESVMKSQKRRRAARSLLESTPLLDTVMPTVDQLRRRVRSAVGSRQ